MADYYVNLTSGSDTTGDGTAGNPWLTPQKFWDSTTSAGAPHFVYMAGAATLAANDLTTHGTPGSTTFLQWDGAAPCEITCATPWIDGTINPSTNINLHGITIVSTGSTTNTSLCINGRATGCTLINAVAGGVAVNCRNTAARLTHCLVSNGGGPGVAIYTQYSTTVIERCVIDARGAGINLGSGNGAVTAVGNLMLLGGGLGLGAGNYLFAGNTVINDPGTRASVFAFTGLIDSNVFVSDQAVKLETASGSGTGNYSRNRLVGYTSIADGAAGTDYYDLGGNQVIESPYRDWQNLDFTVVKPDLIDLTNLAAGIYTPGNTYAGCFAPEAGGGINWPLIRRIAAMGDLRFSPSGVSY